jgi:hypothetical protein
MAVHMRYRTSLLTVTGRQVPYLESKSPLVVPGLMPVSTAGAQSWPTVQTQPLPGKPSDWVGGSLATAKHFNGLKFKGGGSSPACRLQWWQLTTARLQCGFAWQANPHSLS